MTLPAELLTSTGDRGTIARLRQTALEMAAVCDRTATILGSQPSEAMLATLALQLLRCAQLLREMDRASAR